MRTRVGRREVRLLVKALQDAQSDIVWMSGSDDFSPQGKAYRGWRRVLAKWEARERLIATLPPAAWPARKGGARNGPPNPRKN